MSDKEKGTREGMEIAGRLCEAVKYQKMAVRALLPDTVAGHLEVMERELEAMILECVDESIKKKADCHKEKVTKNKGAASGKINKVTIE